MISRSRWVADNGNWIMRKRSGGGQLCPSEHTTRGNSFPATSPLVSATDSGIPAESGVSGSTLGQLQARRRRLSQLDPTRVHPAAAPLRPSAVFAPDHPPLVPKWFMFCGSCFVHWVSPFLPWKSLTTVSPRLCCVLAALLASSLPPVVLLLLLRPPILRSPALA